VGRVVDQHLAFVTLEPRLFSLGLPRAFVQRNDPNANDKDLEVRAPPRPRWGGVHFARADDCFLCSRGLAETPPPPRRWCPTL